MAAGVKKKQGKPMAFYFDNNMFNPEPIEPKFKAQRGAIYTSKGQMWISKGIRLGWAKVHTA